MPQLAEKGKKALPRSAGDDRSMVLSYTTALPALVADLRFAGALIRLSG
jgi:hypothetical protein